MKKLFFILLLLNCPAMALAKITLDVSVFFEQTGEEHKRKVETHHSFDITEQKNICHTEGPITCIWQIINEGSKTVSILGKIVETKDGEAHELAHRFFVTQWGQEAVISVDQIGAGEKDSRGQSNLKITALITQDQD